MRFAAYVVALFFFEVQSQQQCSESLGTCSGSRASLMQVKSFSQKMQTSTGRGASKHAETLAGFQKYTSELVDKYLEDPPSQQSGLGKEVLDAIDIIKQYLQSLYEDFIVAHYHDGNASKWCADSVDRCFENDLPFDMADMLNEYDSKVMNAQGAHATCQTNLKEECSPTDPPEPVCPGYHEHRRANDFPGCGKGGHLKQDYREAQFVLSGDNTMLHTFENCLKKMEEWLDPLYQSYSACEESESSSSIEPTGCATEQLDFETAYCERVSYRDRHCDAFEACIGHAKDHCVNGVTKGEPGECDQIEANWKERQAMNETAERISCLLDVLTSADADKAPGLQACKNRNFKEINAFWVINCFIGEEKPAGGLCVRDLDGCGDAFVKKYYSPFGTVRKDSEATCCETGEGDCFEPCKLQCSSNSR